MKCLVTGAAGFIGSTLAETLLDRGEQVLGLDCFTDYYDISLKRRNLTGLAERPGFSAHEADLTTADLEGLLKGVDVVFHEAAQAGVRASWGDSFHHYTRNNVLATQRLMEACVRAEVERLVFASSSSVYGDCEELPAREDSPLRPISPYGVTKVAVEHLGYLYYKNYGLPTVGLRYFTIYGPRQRPDMAFHRFIRTAFEGRTIEVYGDGYQSRDFTFVSDAVAATLAAAERGRPGTIYNIGGGSRVTIRRVIEILERVMDREISVVYQDRVKGDVRHTAADISRAGADLDYRPGTDLDQGLLAQAFWIEKILDR